MKTFEQFNEAYIGAFAGVSPQVETYVKKITALKKDWDYIIKMVETETGSEFSKKKMPHPVHDLFANDLWDGEFQLREHIKRAEAVSKSIKEYKSKGSM